MSAKSIGVVLLVFIVGLGTGIAVQKKFLESDSNKITQALQILDTVPEIKKLIHQPGIIVMPEPQANKITLDLRDNSDPTHAIMTGSFEVDLDTKQISVYDPLTNTMMAVNDWLTPRHEP